MYLRNNQKVNVMSKFEEIPGFEKVDWNKVEEPVVEPTQEPTKAPVAEPTTETGEPTKDTQAPETPVETPVVNQGVVENKFDISFFNKTFDTQFDTEDALKDAIKNSSKAKELESKLAEYEVLKADIERYKNGINPLDFFASEDDFRVQQFKKQNPDKDATVVYKAFTSDLSKVDDLDVLVMYEMFNNPGLKGGEAGALEDVADQYGLDLEDRNGWTQLQQNKLLKAANAARSEFKKVKGGIELPKHINLSEDREAQAKAQAERQADLKVKWSAAVDNMFSKMEKVPVYDVDQDGKQVELFNYVMDDKSKAVLKQGISDYLVNSGKEITPENVQEAGQIVYERFVLANLGKMMKTYGADLLAKQEKVIDKEIHNAEPVKTDVKQTTEIEREQAEFIANLTGSRGFQKKPLF